MTIETLFDFTIKERILKYGIPSIKGSDQEYIEYYQELLEPLIDKGILFFDYQIYKPIKSEDKKFIHILYKGISIISGILGFNIENDLDSAFSLECFLDERNSKYQVNEDDTLNDLMKKVDQVLLNVNGNTNSIDFKKSVCALYKCSINCILSDLFELKETRFDSVTQCISCLKDYFEDASISFDQRLEYDYKRIRFKNHFIDVVEVSYRCIPLFSLFLIDLEVVKIDYEYSFSKSEMDNTLFKLLNHIDLMH